MTNETPTPSTRRLIFALAALAVLWALFMYPQWTQLNLEPFDGLVALMLGLGKLLAMWTFLSGAFKILRGRWEAGLQKVIPAVIAFAALQLLGSLPVSALVVFGLIALAFVYKNWLIDTLRR